MLNAIWVLVRARLLIARNTFWRGKVRRKIGIGLLLLLVSVAAWGLYNFTGFVVRGISSPQFATLLREAAAQDPTLNLPADITPFLQLVPSVVLFAALIMLVFSSFSSVLSSLYLAGDIDMLLVAPVPMRAVFIVKFFDGLLPQYLLLFALLGPVLLGYGQGMDYGLFYIFTALLFLLLLPLLPAGLGALLVMIVVRIIPARRARDIVSILGGLLGVGFYVITQFVPEVAPRVADVRNLETLLQLNLPLLPSAWAGRALTAAGERDLPTLLVYGGLFTLISLMTFVGCLLVAARLYYIGWSNMAIQGGRVRPKTPKKAVEQQTRPTPRFRGAAVWGALLPDQARAVFLKDWRLFPRDLRNLQQLIFPLALAAIWTFRLVTVDGTSAAAFPGEDAQLIRTIENTGSAGIAFFVCLTLANAIAGAGIGREGRAFWLLKLAPISGLRILLGKLALAYLPFPTVGTLFLVLLAVLRGATAGSFLTGWGLLLLLGLGTTCISLGLGAVFPRLDWENPQQQTTFQAGCLSLLLYSFYLLLVVAAIVGLPFLGTFLVSSFGVDPRLPLMLTFVGWVVGIGMTVLAVWGGLYLGIRGLDRIEL
jgi:ABC-2 type transport system permease protein